MTEEQKKIRQFCVATNPKDAEQQTNLIRVYGDKFRTERLLPYGAIHTLFFIDGLCQAQIYKTFQIWETFCGTRWKAEKDPASFRFPPEDEEPEFEPTTCDTSSGATTITLPVASGTPSVRFKLGPHTFNLDGIQDHDVSVVLTPRKEG